MALAAMLLRMNRPCMLPRLAAHARRNFSENSLKRVAILFPGQGAQYVGMGADIYKDFEAARDVIDECNDALGGGFRELMFNGPQQELTLTANAQPAILCHSIAVLRVLEKHFDFDIKHCRYALGHSLGIYSALVATGAISFKDAVALVRLRGQLMQQSVTDKQTSMRALAIKSEHLDEVEHYMQQLRGSLPKGEVAEIANINSKTQIVLSGTVKGVEQAASALHTKGFAGRSLPLPVSAPFHCSLMSPAAEGMKEALMNTKFSKPCIDVVSNVTGKPFESTQVIPTLLRRQITETVQWQKCVRYARDDYVFDWLFVGPARALSNLLRKDYPNDLIRTMELSQNIQDFKL